MLRSTAARLVTPTPTRSAHAISIHRLRAATPHPASTTRFVHSISPTRNRASTAQTASTSSDNDSSSDAFAGSDRRPVILFDGVCNMCNGGVNFVLDWDPAGKVRFCALQSDAGRKLLQRCNRSPDDISSIVLVEESGFAIKSEAVLKIAQYLQLPFPAAAALALAFPLGLRDTVYDNIAERRYDVFGKSNECRLSDGKFDSRFLS